MNQEINFMYAERPRSDGLFNGRLVLRIILGAWTIMGVTVVYLSLDMDRMRKELQIEQGNLEAQRTRTAETEQRFPPVRISPQLSEKLENMRRERDSKLKLIDMMAGNTVQTGKTPGFHNLLAGISGQQQEGLWFKEISIKNTPGGMTLDLKGGATDPGLVPSFLKGLSNNPVFAGMHFTVLGMTRNDKDPRYIDFTLATPGQEFLSPPKAAGPAAAPKEE